MSLLNYKDNINIAVPCYLMASYLYYIENESMMYDHEYDYLCKFIYDNFDNIQHRHKYLIDKESLKAGTGYKLNKEDYPQIVIGAAYHYMNSRGRW